MILILKMLPHLPSPWIHLIFLLLFCLTFQFGGSLFLMVFLVFADSWLFTCVCAHRSLFGCGGFWV